MATDTAMTSAAPVAVVDLLNSLLESEVNSVFRFMGEGSPYLSRATVEVRKPLQEMVVAGHRRAGELADAINAFGSVPTPHKGIRSEEQYLAFLSLQFLLPKLVTEKELALKHYRNALDRMRTLPQASPEVVSMLERQVAEISSELASLERAAAHVAAANAANHREARKDPSQPAAGTKKGSDAGPAAG
jgi:hypothetical protein